MGRNPGLSTVVRGPVEFILSWTSWPAPGEEICPVEWACETDGGGKFTGGGVGVCP